MRNKQTKIVATISDRNCDVEFLKKLRENGMDVVRINTAHQMPEDTIKVVENIRAASEKLAILVDIKGPEIRTTKFEEEITVQGDEEVRIKGGKEPSTRDLVYVNYDNFVEDVPEGSIILIDDGSLELFVEKNEGDVLVCKTRNSGSIKSNKSVNVPNVSIKLPSLTEKDKLYIKFCAENDIDFIAHSFVRSKADVLAVKDELPAELREEIKVIAKIENREGVDNVDEILDEAYGIMVARGDLGVEIPAEEVPLAQKEMINKCVLRGKPVITATQMLDSMIKNPRATRAEVSDVANAVLDGTDALMLSGETAYGEYPVEAVRTMSTIAKHVEAKKPRFKYLAMKQKAEDNQKLLFAKAAISMTAEIDVKAVLVPSHSGETARILAAFRGHLPIYAPCFNDRVLRRLALTYGVRTDHLDKIGDTDSMIKLSIEQLKTHGRVKEEDKLLVIAASRDSAERVTNFLKINKVHDCLSFKDEDTKEPPKEN